MNVTIIFDRDALYWHDDLKFNIMIINHIIENLNEKLNHSYWICLNDLYDALQLPRTKTGLMYGWENNGDTKIEFELSPIENGPNLEVKITNLVKLL